MKGTHQTSAPGVRTRRGPARGGGRPVPPLTAHAGPMTDLETTVRRIVREEVARALHPAPLPGGPTFADAGDAWLADLERLRRPANTLRRYEEQLRLHLYPDLADQPIAAIDRRRLQEILRRYVTADRHARARGIRSVMISVCEFALQQEWVDHNVARTTTSIRVPRHPVSVPSAADVAALRRAAGARHDDPRATMPLGLMIDVIIGAGGLRLGEMRGLRWADVDLAGAVPSVVVAGTVVQVRRGDRAWERGLHLQPTPKTSTSRRQIAIPAWLAEELRPLEQPGVLVFHTRGGGPYSPANVHSRWRQAAAAAGVPELGPHDLRKYVGTLIADALGVDVASRVLGHASVQVTERHYIARATAVPDVTTLLDQLRG